MAEPDKADIKPEVAESPVNKDPLRLDRAPSETDQFNDLYPQRRGAGYKFSLGEKAAGIANETRDKDLCGHRVVKAVEADKLPLIRLMLSALRSRGCVTDVFERHFSCDVCKPGRNVENLGGFDDSVNQAFICSNNISGSGLVYGTLLRQLITMFDVCTKKYDFRNARHLACTEIRKANLANCNMAVGMTRPGADLFAVRDQQRACVRDTAKLTMEHLKFVPKDVAVQAVDEVFEKCYNDLEPIGRQCHNDFSFVLSDNEKSICGYN